jgi:TPR repeat protein
LSVQIIDRMAGAGVLGRISRWSDEWGARKLNLLSMATWSALFFVMLSTSFVGGNHPGESVEFWGQACEKKQRKACERLIRALDYQSAHGSAIASNQLALHFSEGKITAPNPAAASEFFTLACDQGNMKGCCNLASLYIYDDVGNPDDVTRAISRLEASEFDAEGRNPYFIGLAYTTGRGKSVDKNKALAFFHQSCDAGMLDACIQVARMRMYGEGVPVDLGEAALALEKGSAAGDAMSSFHLADLLYRGEGVPRDESRAITLFEKACAEGSPEACSQLEEIEK